MDILTVSYVVIACLAVGLSAAVVLTRDTVHSAMALVGVMLCLAGLFLLMRQEFIAAIQVIVYAGAIMVLFLFVIMLLNMRQREFLPYHLRAIRIWGGLIAVAFFIFVGLGAYLFWPAADVSGIQTGPRFSVAEIAHVLLTDYLLLFELTSVLLLVAIIGAIVMARRLPDERTNAQLPERTSVGD